MSLLAYCPSLPRSSRSPHRGASLDMDATQRCDRCGAQARVMVLMEASELCFCNHHFDRHKIALADQGGIIIEDDREGVSA